MNNNNTETTRQALTGIVTHIEIEVSADELDGIADNDETIRRKVADRVLASIYGQADDEMLIAAKGDLIEYRDASGNTQTGSFVHRDGSSVVLENSLGVAFVPPYRIVGVV
jgi:hypothetical protein